MGAYENPAMIVDKSGEILAQSFAKASAAIGAGVEGYVKNYNDALEKRREKIIKDQKLASAGEIKAGESALKFQQRINDWKAENPKNIGEEGLLIYDKKAKGIGSGYYDAAKVYYNPSSTSEDRSQAWDQMAQYDKDIGILQNDISNVQVNGDTAAGFVDDSNTVYLPINRGEGENSLTAEQSQLVVQAHSTMNTSGYLNENTEYTAEYDDDNNLLFTFKDINTGDVLFTETVNSRSENAIDMYAVKGYNGKERISEYSVEQGIQNDDGTFTESYKGVTEVSIGDNTRTISTIYPSDAINDKYAQLFKEIKTKLTTSDAKNKAATGARINAFFRSNGYTDEQINDIRLGKGEFEGKTIDETLDATVRQYVIDAITPGYKLNNEGNYVVSKTSEYKKPKETSTPTWQVKLDDLTNNFGVADKISSGSYYLQKQIPATGDAYYQLYKFTGSTGGEATSSLVGSKKYYITDNNTEAVFQAAAAMGMTGSSGLPRY